MRYALTVSPATGRDQIRDLLEQWASHPALRRLVEAAGGTLSEDGGLVSRLERLHELTDEWDLRQGAERSEIVDGPTGLSGDEIEAAAAELGMTGGYDASREHYDHAAVLGATAVASVYRVQHVADLLARGVEIDHIVILGALREIELERELRPARERPEVSRFVPEETPTEFEVLVNAAHGLLVPDGAIKRETRPHPTEHLSTAQAVISGARTVEVRAVASSDPARRATTPDNYRGYAERIAPGESVLCVTSAIYVPQHTFVSLRGLGVQSEYAFEPTGFPAAWMRGLLTGPGNYVQEMRAATFRALELARDL